jgi:hypothetical protein
MLLTFRPKLDKIIELLLYLAYKRPNADKYQAVKFFYLADREHFNQYSRPITFDIYYALPYGPVASTAMDLLEHDRKVMIKAGIDGLPFKTEIVNKIVYIRKPLRPVNCDLFSKSDLKVFDEIIQQYGGFTFDELYHFTHDCADYQSAWRRRHFWSRRSEMDYAEMIDNQQKRAALVEDLTPVAAKM